jgi:hypothetical protein
MRRWNTDRVQDRRKYIRASGKLSDPMLYKPQSDDQA